MTFRIVGWCILVFVFIWSLGMSWFWFLMFIGPSGMPIREHVMLDISPWKNLLSLCVALAGIVYYVKTEG